MYFHLFNLGSFITTIENEQDVLISAYERLVDPEQMGKLYKVLSITSSEIKDTPPGFFPQFQGSEWEESDEE